MKVKPYFNARLLIEVIIVLSLLASYYTIAPALHRKDVVKQTAKETAKQGRSVDHICNILVDQAEDRRDTAPINAKLTHVPLTDVRKAQLERDVKRARDC
jgi:hypothetical protein